jgi:hypothetical protein
MEDDDPLLNLPHYNSTTFPLAVKNQLSEKLKETQDKRLRYHQNIVKLFFTRHKHQRGLLVCHGMGQGKTRLAVSIAETFKKIDPRRRIIVMLSKSLEGNFTSTIESFTGKDRSYVENNYKFISLNASNMFKQVEFVDKTDEQFEYEKRLGSLMDDLRKTSSLNNSLLIIDEAHNLFNAISNGSKNGLALYDLIVETRNIKLIFLTGTPMINDPFELVPCFNMLRGKIKLDIEGGDDTDDEAPANDGNDDETSPTNDDNETSPANDSDDEIPSTHDNDTPEQKQTQTKSRSSHVLSKLEKLRQTKHHKTNDQDSYTLLFAESPDDFFVNFTDGANIKNKEKFINRIYGLTSYYGDLYFDSTKTKPGFPSKIGPNVIKIPMSDYQYTKYIAARILELDEPKKAFKSKQSRFASVQGASSTYRVKSRLISNFAYPEHALGPAQGKKIRTRHPDKLGPEDFENMSTYSPKFIAIMANIDKHKGTPGVLYSQFVSGEGLATFTLYLQYKGFKEYNELVKDESEGITHKKTHRTYTHITGEISPEERHHLIQTFNKPNNADGSVISLLLLSGAVAEGISLKRVRHMHIMEPFWNMARINQVEARAIRMGSHTDLPEPQRNVTVYIYLSDYPKVINEKEIKDDRGEKIKIKKLSEKTTDVDIYEKSIENMHLINQFMVALAESSIDCNLHIDKLDPEVRNRIHCYLCKPTNKRLFHPLLSYDMKLSNTCLPYEEKKETVQEIVAEDGKKYYYKVLPDKSYQLYYYNPTLKGYSKMPRDHYAYATIMSKLLSIT